jgi:hypothetical protein
MLLYDDALIRLRHDELKEHARDGERQWRLRAALAATARRPPLHHRALARLGRSLVRWGGRLQARYGGPTAGQALRAAGR